MGSKITKLAKGLDTPILINEKGRPNGVATLDANGKIPEDELPTDELLVTPSKNGFMSAEDKSKLDEVPSGGIPAGAVMDFAMPTAPAGWLYADGRPVSRTTYANLFAAVGTIYGAGDGLTTFNLPDLRDDFIRGWDDRSDREFGSWQEDAFKSHNHYSDERFNRLSARASDIDNAGTTTAIDPGGATNEYRIGAMVDYWDAATIKNTGGPETRPRNTALYRCIKY